MKKIGIIGTGFISKGLIDLIISKNDFQVSTVLTRSALQSRSDFTHPSLLTNSINELIDNSDIIIECSGEVNYSAQSINQIMKNSIPIITMNTEFNVTVGSYFVNKGFITEAEGDQPGSIAALHEEAVDMGFKPIVYGNIKGFLNHTPSQKDMEFWAKKSGLSLNMVTSFTDGTKVQMEQAFVANGLNATILKQGLSGIETTDIDEDGQKLASIADKENQVISDYLISSKGPPGVFITAKHDANQANALEYYKVGKGPFYTLVKPFHFPHLEIYKTILRVVNSGSVLLNNSNKPTISVASIAKHDLTLGQDISKAIGSFDIRGEAIKIEDNPKHIPIGLLEKATLKRSISKGEIITFDDIQIQDTYALELWSKIINKG